METQANATHPALTNFDPANYIWCKDPDRLYDIFANGDGYFVYPGPAGPIPSVRLEAIRDGLEARRGPGAFNSLLRAEAAVVVGPLLGERRR